MSELSGVGRNDVAQVVQYLGNVGPLNENSSKNGIPTKEGGEQISKNNAPTKEWDEQISKNNAPTKEWDEQISKNNSPVKEGGEQISKNNAPTKEWDEQISKNNASTNESNKEISNNRTSRTAHVTNMSNEYKCPDGFTKVGYPTFSPYRVGIEDVVVGLDISVSSTGVAILTKDSIFLGNISLETPRGASMSSIRRRLEFKKALKQVLSGFTVQKVIVEDVFIGMNADTFRELLNLNNVIDELILSGEVKTRNRTEQIEDIVDSEYLSPYRSLTEDAVSTLIKEGSPLIEDEYYAGIESVVTRVQSRVWKSWIRDAVHDRGGKIFDNAKYLNDKEVVRESLTSLGFNLSNFMGNTANSNSSDSETPNHHQDNQDQKNTSKEPKGLQDRCDALGMAVGYLRDTTCDRDDFKRIFESLKEQQILEDAQKGHGELKMWYEAKLDDSPTFLDAKSDRDVVVLSNTTLNKHVARGIDDVREWLMSVSSPAVVHVVKKASLGGLAKELGFGVSWGQHDFAFTRV